MKTISKITAYMPNGVKIYEVGKGINGEKVYKFSDTVTEIRGVCVKESEIYLFPSFSVYVGGILHSTVFAESLIVEYQNDI